MAKLVTIRQTGSSLSATIPKEMADRLHLAVGDRLLAVETEDGVLLTPFGEVVDRGLGAYAQAAKRFRGAFRELSR